MSGLIVWVIFLLLSTVAVVTAAGMIITMSMYRAGLALMSSFVALAGLFILLDADLMAAIQIMMNVGGMLVMVLFMVMLMIDPGGEMMWDMKRKMKLPGPGAFSMSMPRETPPPAPTPQQPQTPSAAPGDWTCPMHPEVSAPGPGQCPICGMDLVPRAQGDGAQPAIASPDPQRIAPNPQVYTCPMHPEVRQNGPGQCPICGMDLVPAADTAGGHAGHGGGDGPAGMALSGADGGHAGMEMGGGGDHSAHTSSGLSPRQHYEMMVDMAMSTAQLPWALAIGAATAVVLGVLVIRTAWPLATAGPSQDATTMVGELLLSRYMIGFEGAAYLILAGIVGAVIFAKREGPPPTPKVAPAAAAQQAVYTCPMHPEVRQNGPGQCPICGMDLVPATDQPSPAPPAAATTYTCPMHPEIRQDHPGQCPICGMDLVPVASQPTPASPNPQPPTPSPQVYTCPMHPEIRQNGPGQCPICSMDLVPTAAQPTPNPQPPTPSPHGGHR